MGQRAKWVFLEITTWIGTGALGAQHYYGNLKIEGWYDDDSRSIELTRILTTRQAVRANRYRSSDDPLRVCPGDVSSGFDDKDEIRKLALSMWRERFPEAEILVEGRTSIAEPIEVLAWPGHEDKMAQANKLWEAFEDLDGFYYRKNEKQAQALADQWDELMGLRWN